MAVAMETEDRGRDRSGGGTMDILFVVDRLEALVNSSRRVPSVLG